MNLPLAEIATQIAPVSHAALLVDQAGWLLSGSLNVPPNITLIQLPAKCQELNPQENVRHFMRDNCAPMTDRACRWRCCNRSSCRRCARTPTLRA